MSMSKKHEPMSTVAVPDRSMSRDMNFKATTCTLGSLLELSVSYLYSKNDHLLFTHSRIFNNHAASSECDPPSAVHPRLQGP